MGIAAGVLTLCILSSGLSAIGVPPYVHDLVTGAILLVIAILDAPDLARHVTTWQLDRAERALAVDHLICAFVRKVTDRGDLVIAHKNIAFFRKIALATQNLNVLYEKRHFPLLYHARSSLFPDGDL